MKKFHSILFFILLSFCCSAQHSTLRWLKSPINYNSTFIYAFTITNTQINLTWGDNGADSYTLERATDAGFTTALTTVYSGGTNTSYNDTGLTQGTTYYYKIHSKKGGYSDGLNTTSCATISFSPIAWYEPTGLDYPSVTNAYGTTTTGAFHTTVLTSIVNTSGPTLNINGSGSAFEFVQGNIFDKYSAAVPLVKPDQSAANYYIAASSIVLSGDFTICAYIRNNNTITGGRLFEKTDQSQYFFLANTNTVFHFNATDYSVSISALGNIGFSKFVIRRTGTTLGVSTDGGATFNTTTCATTTINLDNIFGGVSGGPLIDCIRLVFVGSSLSQAQCAEVFNYESAANYTPAQRPSPSTKLTVTNIAFGAFSSAPYFSPETFNLQANSALSYPGQFNIGDKTFLMSYNVNDGTHPNDGKLYIYDHSSGDISSVKTIAGLRSNPEGHEIPAFFIYDNRVNIVQFDKHYDQIYQKNLVVRSFGSNFDFNNYVTLPQFSGITTWSQGRAQYPQIIQVGNRLVKITEGYSFSGFSPLFYLEYSDDGGISWTRRTIIDVTGTSTNGAPDWVYPFLIYNEGNDVLVNISHLNTASSPHNQMYASFIIRANTSDDFKTWYNVQGNYSKNIFTAGAFTKSELYTNALIQQTLSGTNSAYLNWTLFTQDSKLYGCVANGLGTGWQLYTQTLGQNDLTLKDIDFSGHTILYADALVSGSYANSLYSRGAPVIVKTGSTSYICYALETNSGNWRIVYFTTTDSGNTWSYGGVFSNDDTKQHFNMMIDFNYEWCNNALLTASVGLSASTGKVFIKKIK